jgi:hypothetical protein
LVLAEDRKNSRTFVMLRAFLVLKKIKQK